MDLSYRCINFSKCWKKDNTQVKMFICRHTVGPFVIQQSRAYSRLTWQAIFIYLFTFMANGRMHLVGTVVTLFQDHF